MSRIRLIHWYLGTRSLLTDLLVKVYRRERSRLSRKLKESVHVTHKVEDVETNTMY